MQQSVSYLIDMGHDEISTVMKKYGPTDDIVYLINGSMKLQPSTFRFCDAVKMTLNYPTMGSVDADIPEWLCIMGPDTWKRFKNSWTHKRLTSRWLIILYNNSIFSNEEKRISTRDYFYRTYNFLCSACVYFNDLQSGSLKPVN